MKPKITLVFLFILPLTTFCQEIIVEHLGSQESTERQKEDYNRHIKTIKESFDQANQFLNENKSCESIQACEKLLQEANNLFDFYKNKNFEAKIARDKINNHIDAMNTYYENIGTGAHLNHDIIYDYNEKYFLRQLKFKIGGFKFKINRLKSKKKELKSVSISKPNEDFWNGKEIINKDNEIGVEDKLTPIVEIFRNSSSMYGLRNIKSKEVIILDNNYEIKKVGQSFAVKRKSSERFDHCSIPTINNWYLVDRTGNQIFKSFDTAFFIDGKLIITRFLNVLRAYNEKDENKNYRRWYKVYQTEELTYNDNLKLLKEEKKERDITVREQYVNGAYNNKLVIDCDTKFYGYNRKYNSQN